MVKHKHPTPQELWKARKQKEEEEKSALLPPGLVNHGNTCFMNSVLQGLIATRLLSDLVHFKEPSPSLTSQSSIPIASWRSPQLTNGHGTAGKYEQSWVQGMPLGDIFVAVMQHAWKVQREGLRESMTPRDILVALGQKYDQYLDFRQQDAHEFLRQLLDAMRMEELDIIKHRQPPPPAEKRRNGKEPLTSRTSHDSSTANERGDRLITFSDMIFGGRLASILVCQECKHISYTFEDFNDLSLSMKPEDYVRKRKRDRFKSLAKKLKLAPNISAVEMQRSSSVPASPRRSADPSNEPDPTFSVESRRRSLDLGKTSDREDDREEVDTHEQASVTAQTPTPLTDQLSTPTNTTPTNDDGSASTIEQDLSSTPSQPSVLNPEPVPSTEQSSVVEKVEEPTSVEPIPSGEQGAEEQPRPGLVGSVSNPSSLESASSAGHMKLKDHVDFVEQEKVGKREPDDSWAKLGRRLSRSVRLGKPRPSKSRSRDTRDLPGLPGKEDAKESEGADLHEMGRARENTKGPPSRDISREREGRTPKLVLEPESTPRISASTERDSSIPRDVLGINASASVSVPPTPPLPNPFARIQLKARASYQSGASNSAKSLRPYQQTSEEAEFLKQLLRDIETTSPLQHFNLFRPPANHDGPTTAAQIWSKVDRLPGIEDCLRMFTAVEVLDGENMVGCRRCWKIANGTYTPRPCTPERGFTDSESDESDDIGGENNTNPAANLSPTSEAESSDDALSMPARHAVSAPTSPVMSSASSFVSVYSQLSNEANPKEPNSRSEPYHKVHPPALDLSASAIASSASLPSYGGLPIPVISTTAAPESPVSPPETARPLTRVLSSPAVTQFFTPFPSGDDSSLRAPSLRRRSFRGRAADGKADSENESTDGEETDTSAQNSPHSDSSSIVVVSTTGSRNVSKERLSPPESPEIPQKPRARVPRSKQVIMRPAYKRYLIATPPPVLVIHLKRFQQTSKTPVISFSPYGLKKLDDFVSFPEYLDLTPFLVPSMEDLSKKHKRRSKVIETERCAYRLYAVVVHIGNMLGGHYVAYTAVPPSDKTEDSGSSTHSTNEASDSGSFASHHPKRPERQWAYISDTIVRLASLEEVLGAKAYICMYERI